MTKNNTPQYIAENTTAKEANASDLSDGAYKLDPIAVHDALWTNDITALQPLLNSPHFSSFVESMTREYKIMLLDLVGKHLNPENAEVFLNDKEPAIRWHLFNRVENLSEEQIERGFKDPSDGVRLNAAKHPRFPKTAQHIDALIQENNNLTMCLAIDFSNEKNIPLTQKQIRKLLSNNWLVVSALLASKNFVPTISQLDKGLPHSEYSIRSLFEDRKDELQIRIEKKQLSETAKLKNTPQQKRRAL
jgi:hypothetical protein